MFDGNTLLAYIVAAIVLVLVPGPGMAWIVAQTVAGGMRRGLQAGLGLETATLLHALAAGLGLSALLAASALAFDILKYLGAAYLVWLGIQAWRKPRIHEPARVATGTETVATGVPLAPPASACSVYLRSVLTGVLNPKVAVFFVAFLPQFVNAERGNVLLQFLILGGILSLIGISNSLTLSYLIGHMGRRFSASQQLNHWRERATGTVFIALGLRLAAQQRI